MPVWVLWPGGEISVDLASRSSVRAFHPFRVRIWSSDNRCRPRELQGSELHGSQSYAKLSHLRPLSADVEENGEPLPAPKLVVHVVALQVACVMGAHVYILRKRGFGDKEG